MLGTPGALSDRVMRPSLPDHPPSRDGPPSPAGTRVYADCVRLTQVATCVKREEPAYTRVPHQGAGATQGRVWAPGSGGQQHGQGGSIGVALGVDAHLADQMGDGALDVGFDPGGPVVETE